MDWTDFDTDSQATIMLSLVTEHGRATPLVWLTVDKATLKDQRNLYEDRVLVRLAEILPPNLKVCIVADRGFGDHKLYRLLTEQLTLTTSSGFAATSPSPRRTESLVPQRPGSAPVAGRVRCAAPRSLPSTTPSWYCGLRTGQGHEAGLVRGRQQH